MQVQKTDDPITEPVMLQGCVISAIRYPKIFIYANVCAIPGRQTPACPVSLRGSIERRKT